MCAWNSGTTMAPRSQAPSPAAVAGDFAPRPWRPTAEYYIAGGIDIRDVIEAFALNYNRGAIVKYIARAGRKPGNDALLDLRKAREHIEREIHRLLVPEDGR
jgi:hypothetical protein